MVKTIVKVLVVVAVIAFVGNFMWNLTLQNWEVSGILTELFSDVSADAESLLAWYVICALVAPTLAFLCPLFALYVLFCGLPRDPDKMREYARAILRHADVVEQIRNERLRDITRIVPRDFSARRARNR